MNSEIKMNLLTITMLNRYKDRRADDLNMLKFAPFSKQHIVQRAEDDIALLEELITYIENK